MLIDSATRCHNVNVVRSYQVSNLLRMTAQVAKSEAYIGGGTTYVLGTGTYHREGYRFSRF